MQITELADELGTTPRALRYYEDMALVKVRRTSRGTREYDRATRDRLQLIVTLRRAGVPVADLRPLLKTYGGDTVGADGAILRTLQVRLDRLDVERAEIKRQIAAIQRPRTAEAGNRQSFHSAPNP